MNNLTFSFRQIDWFTVLGFLLVFFIVYFMTQEQEGMVSACILGTFVYVALGLLLKFRHLNKELLGLAVLCSFLSFANVCISSLGNFDYYKKVIMFSVSILWIVYCCSIKIKKQTLILICIINLVTAMVYIYTFRVGFSMYDGEMLLTLNFPNPNQTGMFLLNTILYLTLFVLSSKIFRYGMVVRGLCLVLMVLLLFMLFLTGCRSALGAYAVFLLLCSTDCIHLKFQRRKWFFILWSVAPLIFVFLYVQYVNVLDLDFSFGMDSQGKSSSTRLGVWKDSLKMLGDCFILGDYSNVEKNIKFSHAHNTHLDVWVCYGILPLLLFMRILYKSAWNTNLKLSTLFQRFSLYAFLACFINGFFEATLVSGSAGLFLLSFGFLLLANSNLETN